MVRGSIPHRGTDFSLLQRIQTSPGAYANSHSTGNSSPFTGVNAGGGGRESVKLPSRPHLGPKLKIIGSILQFPTRLRGFHKNNFTFSLLLFGIEFVYLRTQ
jgi:hypothetical protein